MLDNGNSLFPLGGRSFKYVSDLRRKHKAELGNGWTFIAMNVHAHHSIAKDYGINYERPPSGNREFPSFVTSWQPVLEATNISLWIHLLMPFYVWSACAWPETHSKPTAVENCFVKDVWKNTRNTPATAPNVENPSTALLIKGVRFRLQNRVYIQCMWYVIVFIIS